MTSRCLSQKSTVPTPTLADAIERIFDFGGHEIRVVLIDGNPWWIAADVARVLGYRDSEKATRTLRSRQKGTRSVGTPGGTQSMTVVSESGLYRLVLRSKRADAERFQEWIEDEVLPSIRRTGGYQVEASAPEVTDGSGGELSDLELARAGMRMAALAERAILARKAAEAKVVELEATVVERERVIDDLRGPALAGHILGSASGDRLASELAKTFAQNGLNTGPNKIGAQLDELGWTFTKDEWHNDRKHEAVRRPYQARINAGLIMQRAQTRTGSEGTRKWARPSMALSSRGAVALFVALWESQFPGVELTLETLEAAKRSNKPLRAAKTGQLAVASAALGLVAPVQLALAKGMSPAADPRMPG